MDVSIVIVSYNTSRLLDECIGSIKQETSCIYEIIVVDNASTDGTRGMLQERHPDVLLIENSGNVGFARANNQGFALARGRYFFMLNPDTVVLDRAIDKLAVFMDDNPDVGICGPRNVGPDGELQYSCDHFPSIWNTFCSYTNLVNRFPGIPLFTRSGMRYWDYAETRDVEKVMGCSILIRSELFRRLGGLDGSFFMYFEETDLCFRAIREGSRVVHFPFAAIVHYGGESSKMRTDEKIVNKTIFSIYLASQYYFYRKNYGLLPMLAARCHDLGFGLALMAKNIFRRDPVSRENRMTKGRALCSGAIAAGIPAMVQS